ncbi:MAG: DoxX family protein [Phycisphaerales bacterium JB059]
MASPLQAIRATNPAARHILVLRVLAGAPLAFFGLMHLIGAMPMRPLIEAAGLPAPGLMAILAPIAQLLAGVLLLAGALTRLGALLAIGTMVGALFTHLRIPNDAWPTPAESGAIEPGPEPLFLMFVAIAIVLMSAYILFRGSGAFGLDAKASTSPEPAPA